MSSLPRLMLSTRGGSDIWLLLSSVLAIFDRFPISPYKFPQLLNFFAKTIRQCPSDRSFHSGQSDQRFKRSNDKNTIKWKPGLMIDNETNVENENMGSLISVFTNMNRKMTNHVGKEGNTSCKL